MKNELNFRSLTEEDYEIICEWWRWWRWPAIPREMLPDNGKSGFIVEKNNTPIVSCFLFKTNSTWVKLEWIVSNPQYREEDRQEAIELLINGVEDVCRKMGIKHMFSVGKNKHLLDTHEKLGWLVDKQPSYEKIKNL